MAAYFFSSPIDIDVMLEGEEVRKQIESKAEKDRPVSCPVYYDGESVSGQVRLLVLLLRSLLLLHFCCAENQGRLQFAFVTESARHMTESKSSLWET
jgi:hypothetical protein